MAATYNVLARIPTEKMRQSQIQRACVSVHVEWFGPNMERTNREAPSPSFFAGKFKTPEITWRR